MRFGQNKADELFFGKQIPVKECMEDKFFEEIEKLDFESSSGIAAAGTWQSKFKPEETKKEIFYVSNERQEFVDMMHVEGTFNHAANEKHGCHILELPYTGQDEASRVSMFVFLPPTESNALTNPYPPHLTVLGRGMGKMFENSANFSGFSKKVQVGEVLVKFKITVNEEGQCLPEQRREAFAVMRPDSKQECLLKGFDLDSRKPEQWIGDS
ncbi:SNPR9 protein [Culex quinquefasciatus]|uniref:SNPR9 protein n=1 Tax=Culex quinquefasciatus TaxID=7176 RepID=B0X9U0_CULQU|nr:SRPN9 [Culex quinquefasciatus]EDS43293.1 SRPN9 [Culex quinquefasciatus]EDS43295.1 SNPR9 protein [Culex quinquefasciatus]|eukprot:XP_001866412.1 SRPN9 [Culex quinquefasciatus]